MPAESLNTSQVLRLMVMDSGPWQPAPCPKKGPFVARSTPQHSAVIHDDYWLVKEIHGAGYEWAALLP